MTRGLKTSRGGWRNPLYAPRRRVTAAAPVRTEEEVAAYREQRDQHIDQFFEDQAAKRAARIVNKLVDREARTAVEGDTDLNHDNIEAAE